MKTPNRLPVWLFISILVSVVAGAVAGCGKPAMIGLRPDEPPVEKKWYALLAEFVEVDSLTPTFRWQPLDRAIIGQSISGESPPFIDNVSYELRIWQTVVKGEGKLAYSRLQLTAAEHRLEQPLDPGTRYYWSVRAHVVINGCPRTTEWALAGYLLRGETVPNESCLRFKTPVETTIE